LFFLVFTSAFSSSFFFAAARDFRLKSDVKKERIPFDWIILLLEFLTAMEENVQKRKELLIR